jgi:hypothetical protein
MSAWVVSKTHIDLLITAGLQFPKYGNLRWNASEDDDQWVTAELDHMNADEIGGKLWSENLASVSYRYPNDGSGERPGPVDFEDEQVLTYSHSSIPGRIDPIVVLNALACYEYQSCEHPGWKRSESKRICDALRLDAISRLSGMSDAPWAFDDARYFMHRAA